MSEYPANLADAKETAEHAPVSEQMRHLIAFQTLEEKLGHETAVEVLQAFVSFITESTVDLQTNILNHNEKAARKLTSELRSSCKVMGATYLLQSCLRLEQELQDPDWKRLQPTVNAVLREAKAVGNCAHKLLS